MNAATVAELTAGCPGTVFRTDVPYREITSLGCGGEIPLLAEPEDDRALLALLARLNAGKISYLIVGGGTNLAGSDRPFDGAVIRLSHAFFSAFSAGRHHITAGASIRMAELAASAAEAGYGGLAPLAGIPGCLGGALRMNAGANGRSIGEFVLQLCGSRADGTFWTAEGHEIEWGYRHTSIPDDVVLISAIFNLAPGADPQTESAAIRAELAARRAREPRGRTAGCSFRNVSQLDPAGKLIDRAGLKGMRAGDFEVSAEHANFIVNRGNGSEADLVRLMADIRARVAAESGFYLQPEIVFADPGAASKIQALAPAPKVAVLKGGDSSERDVSLRSGAAVAAALRRAGYDVTEIDLPCCEITPEMRAADVVYPVLHGGFGEGGALQALLEAAHIPFVGNGSEACRLIMDKIETKKRMEAIGLPTPKWGIVTPSSRAVPAGLDFPLVLKAPKEGSTIGIVFAESAADWERSLDEVFRYDSERILVEEKIKGSEYTVPVWTDRVLPVIEIRPPNGIYTYDAKYVYHQGKTQYLCPPESIGEELQRTMSEMTRKFFDAFGCRDILRVDFMLDGEGRPYILEGNAMPGCTATSLVPKAALVCGVSFEQLTSKQVRAALRRSGK